MAGNLREKLMSAHGEDTTPLEWVIAAVSGVIVLAIIGLLLFDHARGNGTPPDVTVHADSVIAVDGGYLVVVTATNAGDVTAAGLVIEGELTGPDGGVLETREVTLAYLPGNKGSRGAGIFFSRDPRAGTLTLRPRGYEEP